LINFLGLSKYCFECGMKVLIGFVVLRRKDEADPKKKKLIKISCRMNVHKLLFYASSFAILVSYVIKFEEPIMGENDRNIIIHLFFENMSETFHK